MDGCGIRAREETGTDGGRRMSDPGVTLSQDEYRRLRKALLYATSCMNAYFNSQPLLVDTGKRDQATRALAIFHAIEAVDANARHAIDHIDTRRAATSRDGDSTEREDG